eukprot:TRINITY_DN1597_c0_g1_i1.p1 TRINITY_DN1597_c0_g1~~TRINITY_DN1597_c0_g1_i1.p1  ORF type:complete len:686 (-),score=177.03 TRINITY_DN1597_c0_g1_i1:155-2212(-)
MTKYWFILAVLFAICLFSEANVHSKIQYYANQQRNEVSNSWGKKLTGKIGHGYNVITGKINLPFGTVDVLHNRKWNGFYIPSNGQVELKSGNTFFKQYNFWDVKAARSLKTEAIRQATNQFVFNQGIFGYDIADLKNDYLNSDHVLAVNVMTNGAINMNLRDTKYLKRNSWAMKALSILPNNYHTYWEKQAYRVFIENWGTHYVRGSDMGTQVQGIDQWNFHYSHSKAPTESKNRFLREMGQNEIGVSVSLTTLPEVDLAFRAYSHLDNWAFGGNIELARGGKFQDYVRTTNRNPGVVRVKAGSLTDFIDNKQKAANIERAIQDYINEAMTRFNAVGTCPKCIHGRCIEGQNTCTCYNHATHRTCSTCASGWGGNKCNVPKCSHCDVAGGTCIAPNKCRCKNCYGGSWCNHYTCGCMAGEGFINLSNNSTLTAADIQVGDVVEVVNKNGEKDFSPVFYVRERDIGEKVGLLKLTTASRAVTVTVDHLVFTAESTSAFFANREATSAGKLTVGTFMWVDVGGKMIAEPITDVSISKTQSMMSIQTLEGNVVIDGVAVSSYETNETWGWLESLEERFVFKFFPSIAKAEWYQKLSNLFEDYIQIPIVDYLMEKLGDDSKIINEEQYETSESASPFEGDDIIEFNGNVNPDDDELQHIDDTYAFEVEEFDMGPQEGDMKNGIIVDEDF